MVARQQDSQSPSRLLLRHAHRIYVLMSIGAAKQDSSVFPDPDRVDITRSALGRLTFGRAGRYASARRWPGWSALI
jgi:hypothetical protein